MSSLQPQRSDEPRRPLNILLAFLSGALLASFLSRWQAPNGEALNFGPTQDKTREESETHQHTRQFPTPAANQSFPLAKNQPQGRDGETEKKTRFKWYGLAVNIGTLAAVIWYAAVATQQRNAMIEQNKTSNQNLALVTQQLEGTSAAKIELSGDSPEVGPTDPPFGQIAIGLINNGHFICPEAIVTLSLALKNYRQDTVRTIVDKRVEKRTMIYPSTQPEGILVPYELSESEWNQAQKTDLYLVLEYTLDYDDGFKRRVVQDDCKAFFFGGPSIGRAVVKCADVPTWLRKAKSKKN